ncbi:MAG: hypothetical protein EPO27_11025 [Betaproteobacteria bacterium]|nr:MAG: hypothetical protein EPO27_11025 [Betaproteobacteria bacterium]
MTIDRFGVRALRWAVLALCGAAAGCATLEEPAQTAKSRDEGVYRTGSRLPSRDTTSGASVGTLSKEDWLGATRRQEGASPPIGTAGN